MECALLASTNPKARNVIRVRAEASNISCFDVIHLLRVFMSTLERIMFMAFIVLLLILRSLPKTVSVM